MMNVNDAGLSLRDSAHLAHRDEFRDPPARAALTVRLVSKAELPGFRPELEAFLLGRGDVALSRMPGILTILAQALRHDPLVLMARQGQQMVGVLPLAHVRSLLFGRFLVSLPYVNSGGVVCDDQAVARRLIDAAAGLADSLSVRYLELRHEQALEHPSLTAAITSKVHMRLNLPSRAEDLWRQLDSKVRNQVRKGTKNGLTVSWGGEDLLDDFYSVFARNMRDLGTPVYGRRLFQCLLREFKARAEIGVVHQDRRALAAALLLHGKGITEVPSASSLRRFNHTNANMLLYWNLLVRAIEKGQDLFDFGRSSVGGNTHQFKKQWGATPAPAVWQYYVRKGTASAMRPDNRRYGIFIRTWTKLPVCVANLFGPAIVRGIP
jgi:FemAB-related protein (PEP-CTERM system-associated)